ncbi:hypothetical protein CHARACLAT_014592 [Characodon lateralis]|uniref:Uncharacterized protein n=1 Tax=Characodon lateralis TaxID=208331 RepID=A0ABU7DIS4_9TELE|nr:hypothetical protein [Characodon lateralis]
MQSDYTNCSKGYWTSQGRDIEGPNANRVHSKVLLVARTVAVYRGRLPNPLDDSTPEGRRPKPLGQLQPSQDLKKGDQPMKDDGPPQAKELSANHWRVIEEVGEERYFYNGHNNPLGSATFALNKITDEKKMSFIFLKSPKLKMYRRWTFLHVCSLSSSLLCYVGLFFPCFYQSLSGLTELSPHQNH